MKRKENLLRVEKTEKSGDSWDLVVIGGGASGLGVALDALSRGLQVLLLEKADFAKGTSSRSTKLVHGGVRYLAQGEVGLVFEALKERGRLLKNAPHLTVNQPFIIPLYTIFDRLKYSIGLKIYDWMAGGLRLGKSRFISPEETYRRLPKIRRENLRGGIVYHDGQFDDARLALMVARTCDDMGGCMLNYTKVNELSKDASGRINGLVFRDVVGKNNYKVRAKTVVNATGVFADKILQMDRPDAQKMIQPSQGVHLVLDGSFLGGSDALMIPETSDGRVLFAVPWQGKLVVGTTDTLRKKPKMEPQPLSSEITFILETAGQYLKKAPRREDVLSVFAGLRPLAAPKEGSTKTKEISRSHKVIVSDSQLVTITGGKWTTFRKMGEDTVDVHYRIHGIKAVESTSAGKHLHGYLEHPEEGPLHLYGADAATIRALQQSNPEWAQPIHPDYPYTGAEVVWSVREEMAIKVEDFLSRRCRILLLDAKAALHMAPRVAALMAAELGKDEEWIMSELEEFYKLAKKYLIQT
ncbi:FAD-dependent oxidoreductase [Cyclobacterium xiamenense]|jgi:glycerol-3-phosphate dehydrogenase|uniref:glycerol-3-phosphate dehydrogenase/oxidase n=1 Tax=Cyclobacterium xiamenense TaxID=1297121 RepID=UPI0035CF5C64